jgi:tetrahydromethanopterin S-methyltransferase subunit G
MSIMTGPGTEKRIDELSKRVDFGFAQTNQRLTRVEDDVRALRTEMNARFDSVDARFDSVNARFDHLQHLMIGFFATTLGMIIVGVIVNLILSHS